MAVFDIIPTTGIVTGDDIRDTLAAGGGSVNDNALTWFKPEAKINIWSLSKPNFMIQDEEVPDTEKRRSGGLLIPSYAPADINELGILNHSIWLYPRAYNTYRWADFRGYNKNAWPPITSLLVTPNPGSSVRIGDKLKFVYNMSGFNPFSVYFNLGALTDLFLGVVVTAKKGTGTSEDGTPFPWDFTSEYAIHRIEDYYLWDSSQGAIGNNYTEITLRRTYEIKPGATIACLLCLFSTRNKNTARVTSMLLPADDPADIFIADTIHTFKVI